MEEENEKTLYDRQYYEPGFRLNQCRISAESGYAPAQNALAVCYKYGRGGVSKDYAAAVYWYQKAAEQGHAAAQRSLGYCYENGHGVEQSWEKAIYWYEQGAIGGDADAQQNLANCYQFMPEVFEPDLKKAVYWYKKAAEQDHPGAQCNLGVCYGKGNGVKQNYKNDLIYPPQK